MLQKIALKYRIAYVIGFGFKSPVFELKLPESLEGIWLVFGCCQIKSWQLGARQVNRLNVWIG